jgi:DNA-binding SARP family transcriptional activator
LGPFEVLREGEQLTLGGTRRRAVLAMLALDAGRVVSVSRLVEGVWGEEPPETAVTALHGHVSHLRRALGDVVVTRAPGYVLDVDPGTVDITRCERLLDSGRLSLATGDAAAARGTLDEALALWRGPPLDDLADAPFADAALPALEELVLAVREERAEAELALGNTDAVIPELKAIVAEQPLRERPRRQLMLALYRAGRDAEALEAYDQARRRFSEELGIEPGEPLRRMHEAILRADPELGPRRRDPARRARRRRSRAAVAALVAGLAAVGAAAVFALGGDDKPPSVPPLRGAGLVRIDPSSMRVAEAVPLEGTPSDVAAADDRAWVINEDDQTITEVSAAGRRLRTFSTGASPTGIAAGGGELWVTEGRRGASQFLGARTVSIAHLAGPLHAMRDRIELPTSGGSVSAAASDRVALSRRAVWAIGGDGSLVRIDPLSDEVARVLPLRAVAVAASGDRAWVLTSDRSLVPLAEGTVGEGAPIDATPGAEAIAVGGGAIWVSDAGAGELVRIDAADPSARRRASVGAGAGAVAFGAGSAWIVDPARGRVLRADADSGAVTGEVATGGTPRDLAVSEDAVWVSVGPSASTETTACGPLQQGEARPDVLLVADLPLRRGRRSPTHSMALAIGEVVKRSGYRAGRLRVGYRICDDSTEEAATFDAKKCASNARAYAADRRVVVEVGPYNSGCAREQIPIASKAPNGPLAMISPTNTDPLLTRDVQPNARRAYARIIAREDRVAEAMAQELKARGARTVFVVDDGEYGLDPAGYFAVAARAAGLRVLGRASWTGRRTAATARRVARSGADAVYVSGLLDNGAGAMIHSLRRALPDVTIAGGDALLPVASLFADAGTAARGTLLGIGWLPVSAMPAAGRAAAAEIAEAQRLDRAHSYAVYAAHATELALDAISRSDGSRRSVAGELLKTKLLDSPLGPTVFDGRGDLRNAPVAILRARYGGGSRDLVSTDGAELVTVRRSR